MRAVPDVALTAASHDGYLVCENGSWYIFAGTSAASPTFAGIVSLVVEERGGVGQGNANPALYGLLGTGGNPFHATPTGNNSVPGLHGFTASGAAYNLATGLGSVDGDLLVKSWPVAGSGNTHKGFALKPSVGAVTLVAGKSARFTLSLAVSGDFGNSVTLKAATVAGVSVAFSPASIQPGTTSLVVVRVAGAAAAGASKLVLTGTSAGTSLGTTATASVGLTVLAAPKHSRRVD
jgi:subtilase family serine protease